MITNRENLIRQLAEPNWIDDGGASYEALITHYIQCPYKTRNENAMCTNKKISTDLCFKCKEKWLNKKCDYYD